MSQLSAENIRSLVFTYLREHYGMSVAELDAISLSANLIDLGVIDSMGVVGLLGYLEEQTGATIDLAEADPEHFTTLGGLVQYTLQATSR